MRQIVRRLRSVESGSALVEYGLIIAVIALGLIAVLGMARNSVGDLTNQTAVTVGRASAQGYGSVVPAAHPPIADRSPPAAPDSADTEPPDSTSAATRFHPLGLVGR
jgi:Flp pilus assembly pilin Flp